MIVSVPFSAARPSVRMVDLQLSVAIWLSFAFDSISDRDFAHGPCASGCGFPSDCFIGRVSKWRDDHVRNCVSLHDPNGP